MRYVDFCPFGFYFGHHSVENLFYMLYNLISSFLVNASNAKAFCSGSLGKI